MFSIIMPVWNRADMIKKSIESILAQTFEDYELLIIDDGSEDNLEEIIHPYLSENIIYHKIPHSGASRARNFGIQHAKGDFIAYLDSDNVWHPDFLSRMYGALNNATVKKEVAYCICNVYKEDQANGHIYLTPHTVGGEFNFKRLLFRNYIDLNAFVHSKKCIGHVGLFDERLKRFIDWDFILRICSKYEPAFVPHFLVDYYLGIAENAITLEEEVKIAADIIGKKNEKYKKPVSICHDAITYTWEGLSDEKYNNWVRMNNEELDTTDFKAWGFPYMLQIEPTNRCNLACPLGPVGMNELVREPRDMSIKEFKSLIDDMEAYLLFLVLWDWGEPFMNPEFPGMIKYAAEKGIKTVTSTNAHFLHNKAYVEEILKSGLSSLIVAVDCLNEEHYAAYRKKGNIGKVISGLENVLTLKKQLGSKTLINMRMVIMKYNERELGNMKRLAGKLKIDKFTVKTVNPSCGMNSMDKDIIPNNPKYRRYVYKKGTYERVRLNAICRRVWQMSNIFSNGAVVPCCYDYKAELKVGNIREEPFTKIWNSPAYRELRKKVYHQKDSIPKCRECTINFKLAGDDWFREAYDYNTSINTRLINKIKRYTKLFAVKGCA